MCVQNSESHQLKHPLRAVFEHFGCVRVKIPLKLQQLTVFSSHSSSHIANPPPVLFRGFVCSSTTPERSRCFFTNTKKPFVAAAQLSRQSQFYTITAYTFFERRKTITTHVLSSDLNNWSLLESGISITHFLPCSLKKKEMRVCVEYTCHIELSRFPQRECWLGRN